MKKLLISMLVMSMVNITYGEQLYKFYNSKGEVITLDGKDMEMQNRWQKIKEMDARMMFEPDKNRLKAIHDEYEKEFEIYMEYLKKNSERLFIAGDYYFRSGRYEKSFEVFSQDEKNVKNLFGAATSARFLNDNINALKYYNKAIDKNPDFYESYLGRGIVNRNVGNYDGAVSDFMKYMEYKQDESVYLGLGDTYMASGRFVEAKNVLEKGRSKFPESGLIKEMLMRVYAKLK
ncbi:tetratricopeptide repeat protein [Fusobacterium sp.]|uniref:tetratricopeptide repeat protein n=1 Tax=Fusobacterium sp. TaxID=68766 RepID=UPI00396C8FDA